MAMKLSPAQIGQGVVLLVRYKSLLHGIESAPMTQGTTDFSNHRGQRTQQVISAWAYPPPGPPCEPARQSPEAKPTRLPVRGTSGQVADGQGEAG